MKATKEFRALSAEQRVERMREFKKELLKLQGERATGSSPASPGKLQQTRKHIARLKTLLHEK